MTAVRGKGRRRRLTTALVEAASHNLPPHCSKFRM